MAAGRTELMLAIERWPDILKADLETRRQRLVQALQEVGIRLPADRDLQGQLDRALVFSDFITESSICDPLLLNDLWNSGAVQRPTAAGAVASRLMACLEGTDGIDDLAGRLRRFRRREMVRIAWRDLNGLADLTATTSDLSDLADACLNQTLAWLHAAQCAERDAPLSADGTPMELVVLALGKLDVDENPATAEKFQVFSIPTMIIFKDGKEVQRLIGFRGKEQLKRDLEAAI